MISNEEDLVNFVEGKWIWNEETENFEFQATPDLSNAIEETVLTKGFKFLRLPDRRLVAAFRKEFQRSDTTLDAEYILVQDIKDLVLFLAPSEMMTAKFLRFVHTRTVHQMLHSLIIYFEYFLKMVEYVFIRRDESSNEHAMLESGDSKRMKRIFSGYLSQYRIFIGQDYSKILLGEGDMAPFYHSNTLLKVTNTEKDLKLHEQFLAFATQVVWIAMHRRAYDIIDGEMCRLFRSEHFMLTRRPLQFNQAERDLLYGKNYKRTNYRQQNSPLIQEVSKISLENKPILSFGQYKYRGEDLRLMQLEMEFLVPESQLCLIDVAHGILGHPKKLYNDLFVIDSEAARREQYNENYDPYRIFRQPELVIPNLDEEELRKKAKHFEPIFTVKRHFEPLTKEMQKKWMQRDYIVANFHYDVITDPVEIAQRELDSEVPFPSAKEMLKTFLEKKEKLRKN